MRDLLQHRLTHVLLVGGLASTLDILRGLPLFLSADELAWRAIFDVYLVAAIMSVLIVTAVSLAEASALRGGPKAVLMVLAAWAATATGITCVFVLSLLVPLTSLVSTGVISSLASTLMYVAWQFTAIGTAVALLYAARGRDLRLAEAARKTELERANMQRSMMASRLSVLRARVEPEFLFDALNKVAALYRCDRDAADEMIDALIAYLRAALPQMRGEISSIGSEIDLVRSYVAVLHAPRGGAVQLDAQADVEVRDEVLPPMVLMPLAQAAFGPDAGLRQRFAISASRSVDGTSVVIEIEGGKRPAAWRGSGPETSDRTLNAYFGAGAKLRFESTGTIHRARIVLLPSTQVALQPAL